MSSTKGTNGNGYRNGHGNGNGNGHATGSKAGGGKGNGLQGPTLGIVEWLRPGEEERVERLLEMMRCAGIRHLRTGISWADHHTPEGEEWYAWLLPRLAAEVEVLPCFLYTPPSLGVVPSCAAPPREPRRYADFVDQIITLYGEHFEWVELWNEPNNRSEWDFTLDPEWKTFAEMVGGAAYWARTRGKKTLLGGMSPVETTWLWLMGTYGLLEHIDAVGIHGFPGTWEVRWEGWGSVIEKTRAMLRDLGSDADVWITEAGYSTRRHDELEQVRAFDELMRAEVERVYWYSAFDLDASLPSVTGFHMDERDYHFGLFSSRGEPKLLGRLLTSGGTESVHELATVPTPKLVRRDDDRHVLITGGSGFVGTNLANRLLEQGKRVLLLDNLSRPGVEQNLRWLRQTHGDRVEISISDIRNRWRVREAVASAEAVFHFAAQVAVTTSLVAPEDDFGVNAQGTLTLLEALRELDEPPPIIFTSTNKVYGGLEDVEMEVTGDRYQPVDREIRDNGIGEWRSLDFHSPYGCSKGTADQYVIDYARTYGLRSAVFRMSCIYGPHQFGTEDQGWVAHFLIRALAGSPITLYGDGMQVRDVLFVEDLVDAFLATLERIDTLSGRAFNVGGGPANSVSLLELLQIIEELTGQRTSVSFADWRPGDQRYYVSDTSRLTAATGWRPRRGVREGVRLLHDWLVAAGRESAVARRLAEVAA